LPLWYLEKALSKVKTLHIRVPMDRQLKIVIAVNSVLIVLFLLGNYAVSSIFSYCVDRGILLQSVSWNPVTIGVFMGGHVYDHQLFAPIGGNIVFPNFIFLLFFISTAVNLYFIFKQGNGKKALPKYSRLASVGLG
jgi:hypothetical protein